MIQEKTTHHTFFAWCPLKRISLTSGLANWVDGVKKRKGRKYLTICKQNVDFLHTRLFSAILASVDKSYLTYPYPTHRIDKPEAHWPQCSPEWTALKAKFNILDLNVEFVQLLYAWWRTTQQTFIKTFSQNTCSEIAMKTYFHFSHYKSMEILCCHSNESTWATAIKT